ncbi:transposase [Sphingobacterium hotanense]|uniref:transposase n=1 Tax=Sphingobacterium hotanense TaxID=649196 RepID=UPI0011F3D5DA|nr:transposase [Sphingobacterium hotanense]
MINQAKALKLIKLYQYVCDKYDSELQYYCQRFSNNNKPDFTDQEVLTIYLFSVHEEQRLRIKQIHKFASDYLMDWFPKLTSYVAFNTRINRLFDVLRSLCQSVIEDFAPEECSREFSLLDSMPIITCSGTRRAKVALEITDKSFCSTKRLWYFGLKLHALNSYNKSKLPRPESIVISKESESDLNIFKENWASIAGRTFFGDKIYRDAPFFEWFYKEKKSIMYTPIRETQGKPDCLKNRDRAYNDLFSRAVSRVRQPIESFFNWINEKTQIQNASKVRSTKGLLVHVFGKLTACFIKPIFNP